MKAPRDILIYVGVDLMGDGLIKLPFLRALRAAFPRARMTWLAGKGKSAYAGRLKPLVAGLLDEVIEDAGIGSHWSELLRRPLPRRSFDLVIDTQRRALTCLVLRRVRHGEFLSGCSNYLWSDRRPAGAPVGAYKKPKAMIAQMLELVALAAGADEPPAIAGGIELPDAARAEARRLLPGSARRVALAPGAGGRHKCWPLERFAALANRLHGDGVVPIFVLGPEETEWQAELGAACPAACFPLTAADAKLDLEPMLSMALAELCDACVANDAGTGHIFAASGRPLVSLFGPTSPEKFAPYCDKLAIVTSQATAGSERMQDIPLEAVAKALAPFLAQTE